MAWKLKEPEKTAALEAASEDLRKTVSDIILDVEKRGDAAVREYSVKFDGVDRASYRLTDQEIQAATRCFTHQGTIYIFHLFTPLHTQSYSLNPLIKYTYLNKKIA